MISPRVVLVRVYSAFLKIIVALAAVGACVGYGLAPTAIRFVGSVARMWLVDRFGWPLATLISAVAVLVLLFVLAVLWLGTRRVHRRFERRALARWCMREDWSPVDTTVDWPWRADQPTLGTVTVDWAVAGRRHGLPVTVGWLNWASDGLGGATDRPAGRGLFTVVQLPGSYRRTAVQPRRDLSVPPHAKRRFDIRYRILIDDLTFADQITSEALRAAHMSRRIPPWTVTGDRLYTIVRCRRPLSQRRIRRAVLRTMRVLDLLGLRPAQGCPESSGKPASALDTATGRAQPERP